VINHSLVAVIQEAAKHEAIEGVYGMVHGVGGLLRENLIDLRRERQETIQGLLSTPASALGSCRYKVTPQDYERILQIFRAHNVRYFVYIGGNDSMDTAHRVAQLADDRRYELRVMGVPKTMDNDLALTDHCPGYGSAARFIALATMDTGKDLEAMRTFDDVNILETLGRNAGWLAASAFLAKRSAEDAPHLVYVPERTFHEDEFLEDVRETHRELGYVFVAVSQAIRDEQHRTVGTDLSSVAEDAFGHKTMSQSSGTANYLRRIVSEKLGLHARVLRPSLIARDFTSCVSRPDQKEAYLTGRSAVSHAVQGNSGYMVTLVREPGPTYGCTTGLAPLQDVANTDKLLPQEYINERGNGITEAFREYALPLLGDPLPRYVRLERFAVPKKLE